MVLECLLRGNEEVPFKGDSVRELRFRLGNCQVRFRWRLDRSSIEEDLVTFGHFFDVDIFPKSFA